MPPFILLRNRTPFLEIIPHAVSHAQGHKIRALRSSCVILSSVIRSGLSHLFVFPQKRDRKCCQGCKYNADPWRHFWFCLFDRQTGTDILFYEFSSLMCNRSIPFLQLVISFKHWHPNFSYQPICFDGICLFFWFSDRRIFTSLWKDVVILWRLQHFSFVDIWYFYKIKKNFWTIFQNSAETSYLAREEIQQVSKNPWGHSERNLKLVIVYVKWINDFWI